MRTMVSFASEPEPVKNTWLNCGGEISTSSAASCTAGTLVVLKKLL